MKKKLLAVATLVLAICLSLTISVRAEDSGADQYKESKHVASVTKGESTKYYERLDAALAATEDGAEVKLLKDLSVPTDSGDNGYILANADKTYTLDLNGKKIESAGSFTMAITKGTITITDSSSAKTGAIKNSKNGPAIVVCSKSSLTIKGGTYETVLEDGKAPAATIQVGNLSDEAKDAGTLVVENGATVKGSVSAFADGSSITVNGGTINGGKTFAVSGNGANSKNSTITINGGTLTSDETAVIYQPQTGTLNVKGGTLTGKFGIVARRGNVNVTGGTITATGTGEAAVGDAKDKEGNRIQLKSGTAFVIDNASEGYTGDAKVIIDGGTVNANALILYSLDDEEEHKDFVVTGGKFDKVVDVAYVSTDKAEVKVGDKYYIGDDATKAIAEAIKDEKTVIEVLKGNVTIEGAVPGVTVVNSGNGDVTVNGMKVTADDEVVVPAPEKDDKDPTPDTGVDVFTVAGAILVVSALGVLVLNKRK